MSAAQTITITDADITRVAELIETSGIVQGEDRTVLEAIFFLAGQATADEAEVQGFMPIYMRVEGIKGSNALPAVQLNTSVLGLGLQASYQGLGASASS